MIRQLGDALGPEAGPDGRLLERFLGSRDGDAFAALVRRHGPMVLGVCRRVLGNAHDAEDAFQATFMVLARRAASVRPRGMVGSWLYGVAHRTALEARRAAARRRSKEARAMPRPETAATGPADLREALDQELALLPPKYRTPVVLCDLEGRTRKEAAAQLGWPEGTVASRLATARRRLARQLSRRGVGLSGAAVTAVLSANAAPAAVPARLVASTAAAAVRVAAGGTARGALSAAVAALTEGVLKTMLLTRLKIGVVVLAVFAAAGGAAWLRQPARAAQQAALAPEPAADGVGARGGGDPADPPLKEGWVKTVPIPNPILGEGDEYVVWVEKGWLQVRRQTRDGKTDWHVVLARATDPRAPNVTAPKDGISLEVSYRDGRYFVRETAEVLRCVRERKRGADGTWPRAHFVSAGSRNAGSAGSAEQQPTLAGWEDKDWFVALSGPGPDRVDCMMRLDASADAGNGYGFSACADGLRRAFHGDTWVLDDGELLAATRQLEAVAKVRKVRAATRARLVGAPAPALEGQRWYNAARPPAWPDLRGKVVLLDFWGTWCGPCVQKLPEVQALFDKYRDRGLVVVGVHSNQGAEKLEEFLQRHKFTFPVVADTGKTHESYAIEAVPCYVLVDKAGKVVRGLSHTVPKADEIERLLGK
jgi:RNA polymerase sigma factor (sigma-70 family)